MRDHRAKNVVPLRSVKDSRKEKKKKMKVKRKKNETKNTELWEKERENYESWRVFSRDLEKP